jgi:hypothetical protein
LPSEAATDERLRRTSQYVEALRDVRTKLASVFIGLLFVVLVFCL